MTNDSTSPPHPNPHTNPTALDEAVAAILVVDGQAGLTTLDEEIAKFLRLQKNKPVYVAVNKCEQANMGEALASNFWRLGLGRPWPVSGLHGSGIAEVLEEMLPHIYHVRKSLVELFWGWKRGRCFVWGWGCVVCVYASPPTNKPPKHTNNAHTTHRWRRRSGTTPSAWPSWGGPTWVSPRC